MSIDRDSIPSIPGRKTPPTGLAQAAEMLHSASQRMQEATYRASRQGLKQLAALPQSVRSMVAGNPIEVDGQILDYEVQLAQKLDSFISASRTSPRNIKEFRELANEATSVSMGDRIELPHVEDIHIKTRAGSLDARHYLPVEHDVPTPCLVYLHGGGWVSGGLETHDNLCRLLARQSLVRVISIDYRLAPETKFPGPLEDCIDAFQYVATHKAKFGIEGKVAIGGDSAGANMAIVACLQALDNPDMVMPDFQLLFVPATLALNDFPSRTLFKRGFFFNEDDMHIYMNHYLHDEAELNDPRVSPLLAPSFVGLPPAHIATAGFDPLRDEGEAYAARLDDAGVHVSLRRHSSLVHPFANLIGFSDACYDAVVLAAGALYHGLHTSHPPRKHNQLPG